MTVLNLHQAGCYNSEAKLLTSFTDDENDEDDVIQVKIHGLDDSEPATPDKDDSGRIKIELDEDDLKPEPDHDDDASGVIAIPIDLEHEGN